MQCWHRLALALHRGVDELKESMTYLEFLSWQAYFDEHPFGAEWDDIRMAVLSANIVATLTGKKQTVTDHMARIKKTATPARRQSAAQQMAILKNWTAGK